MDVEYIFERILDDNKMFIYDIDGNDIHEIYTITKGEFVDLLTDLSKIKKINLDAELDTVGMNIRLIHVAAMINDTEFLKWLIENGADVNAKVVPDCRDLFENDDLFMRDLTPLHFSVINANVDAVKMLLAASKESVNKMGCFETDNGNFVYDFLEGTPIHHAIVYCDEKETIEPILKALLEAGADPQIIFRNKYDYNGNAYYLALYCDNRAAWDVLTTWSPWKPDDTPDDILNLWKKDAESKVRERYLAYTADA